MAASAPSASNRSMTTTVHPSRWAPRQKRSGAAWYSGAGDRYTDPGVAPNRASAIAAIESAWPSGAPDNGDFTPLGRPVVPEE